MSLLFDPASGNTEPAEDAPEEKVFGERYYGRYHLPLLPGEKGTLSGGDYVPHGVMSATKLARAIVDSERLAIWDRQHGQIGLGLRPDLAERLTYAVNRAAHEGARWSDLKDSPAGRELVKALAEIHDEAKTASGGNLAAVMGTNRHDVWEDRARTGLLFGTPAINRDIQALERLLDAEGLERVPGMQERVVRNVGLSAAGRIDDVLRSRKTGRLYLADLKTKRTPFYSWLEAWIQQAVYATAEWVLVHGDGGAMEYIPGPLHHVDQETAVLLRMPSDGAEPYLQRVDVQVGYRWARLAKDVTDARSEARSVATHRLADWRGEL